MRNLVALSVAVVSMTFAGSATATSAVELEVEGGEQNGEHCSITADNCVVHMVNEGHVEVTGHLFGFESHQLGCNHEYTLKLAEDGSGQIGSFLFTGEDAGCSNYVACNTPWPFTSEETGANTGELLLNMCFDGTALGECAGNIDLLLTEVAPHDYEIAAFDARVGSTFCEFTGEWHLEGTPVEFVHL